MIKQLMKLPSIFFLAVLSLFFYLLIIDRNPSEIPSVLINKKVPEFKTQSLLTNKEFVSYREFENQIVVVNFLRLGVNHVETNTILLKKSLIKKK